MAEPAADTPPRDNRDAALDSAREALSAIARFSREKFARDWGARGLIEIERALIEGDGQ